MMADIVVRLEDKAEGWKIEVIKNRYGERDSWTVDRSSVEVLSLDFHDDDLIRSGTLFRLSRSIPALTNPDVYVYRPNRSFPEFGLFEADVKELNAVVKESSFRPTSYAGIVNDIVSVQPMTSPSGLVFYMDYRYESTKVDLSHFPHVCVRCGAPAYNGLMSSECSVGCG